MHFRVSHVCANKVDEQETNFSFTHSSTEAEIISFDAGLRMDGIAALTLWDLVIEVFHSERNKNDKPKEKLRGNPLQATKPNMHNLI